ncbi:hypothetical protein H671_xg20741 [Cricetulus griseus]|uniref:Uncharacterized protein n=1 Tax=Cricetulus griseus TaxID=10029 RepID=A0A061HZ74_CRIGR|nr:hypothetical protein H671_xg20741 [Cricetulus griseus]
MKTKLIQKVKQGHLHESRDRAGRRAVQRGAEHNLLSVAYKNLQAAGPPEGSSQASSRRLTPLTRSCR